MWNEWRIGAQDIHIPSSAGFRVCCRLVSLVVVVVVVVIVVVYNRYKYIIWGAGHTYSFLGGPQGVLPANVEQVE